MPSPPVMSGTAADMDPLMDDLESLWYPTAPVPIVAVPATRVSRLRGRRVVTGSPEYGWRYDLRADDPVENAGQVFVPVLAEYDYYRAEIDQVEVFAPLVPVDRVWVERLEPRGNGVHEPGRADDEQRDLLARLVTLDAPPVRRPVPARALPGLTGRRVVVMSPTRERRDLRATTEAYQSAEDRICVRVCREPDWYRWAFTGTPAAGTEVPIYLIWVE